MKYYLVCEDCKKRIALGESSTIERDLRLKDLINYLVDDGRVSVDRELKGFLDRVSPFTLEVGEVKLDPSKGIVKLKGLVDLLSDHNGHKVWVYHENKRINKEALPWKVMKNGFLRDRRDWDLNLKWSLHE